MVATSKMNKRSVQGLRYIPTPAEHIASILTHAVLIPLTVVASLFLVLKSCSLSHFYVSVVYSICLVVLFTVSTAFHVAFYFNNNVRLIESLRKSDRAVIYLFIAASYTPWLFLVPLPEDKLFIHFRWLIWLLAGTGVFFELTYSQRYPVLGIVFYIVYGIVPGLLLDSQMKFPGVSELKYSGAFYLIGVIFFKSERFIPFAHAIWHIFVNLGVITHYLTVFNYFYFGFPCDASTSSEEM